jgi:hypothetical protein
VFVGGSSAGCSVAQKQVQCSSVGFGKAQYNAGQLSGVQRRSEGAVWIRGCSVAQKKDAVNVSRLHGSSIG